MHFTSYLASLRAALLIWDPTRHALRLAELLLACPATSECVAASPALLCEAAREALREAAFRDRVLVLEYLRGPEVGLCGQDASRCCGPLLALQPVLTAVIEVIERMPPSHIRDADAKAPSQHALRLAELLLACPATSECVAYVP
eukprot:m51a1_g10674 hypothetical protein (145) ;mRNA; f:42701-50302